MERLYLERGGYRPAAAGPLGAADPRGYVALESFERILGALSQAIDAPRSPVLLDGVEGAGKTLLLRVLAGRERWGRRRVVFSPFLHLPAEDVARWLLHLLGRDARCEGPADAAFLAEVRQRDGARTILLVDEIQCSPEASVRRLAELALAGRPQLVVVAAGASGSRLDAARVLLEPELRLSLPCELPASEMEDLCDALLASSARVARSVASPGVRSALLREAGGVPGALMAALARRTRGREETIYSPLLDSVRGPEPPLAVPCLPVPSARDEAGKARQPVAAPGSAGVPPGVSPAPTTVGWLARVARAAAGRRASRSAPASQRWTRVEAAASRRAAEPLAPSPQADPSNAPWLPRAGVGGAGRPALPAPAPPRRAQPAAPGWLRRAGAVAQALLASSRAQPAAPGWLRRAGAAVQALLASGGRAVRGTGSVLSGASQGGLAGLASARRATARALFAGERWKATAAAALVVVGTLSALALAREAGERATPELARAAGAAPPAEASSSAGEPAAVAAAARQIAPAPLRVQVNARPWAYIRVDGVDVGPTPLSLVQLSPGRYEFEAAFPDGRRVRRSVEITPEHRFVSMP